MAKLRDPRRLPALVRHIVLATLPASIGVAACGGSDGNGSADANDNETNCGMCGCNFNGQHTQVVPYVPWCAHPGAEPVDASSDAEADGDADASADASHDAIFVGGDTDCPDAPEEPLNCAVHCPMASPGAGFPFSCRLIVGETGDKSVECTYVQPCGRRPAALVARGEVECVDGVGRQLAEAAFLEAASIDAFVILAGELSSHRAPRSLVRAARRAARDEVRHARSMRALARRRGAKPAAPKTMRTGARTLEAIATENAVEGCVRETYGALVAAWQAETARDRSVRRAMKRIARDEATHAALAFSVALWAERRLDPAARDRVAGARRAAVETLRVELARETDASVARTLGLPLRAQALALVERADALLWSDRAT